MINVIPMNQQDKMQKQPKGTLGSHKKSKNQRSLRRKSKENNRKDSSLLSQLGLRQKQLKMIVTNEKQFSLTFTASNLLCSNADDP